MADGREFRARIVVSDAGALNTFERLLPADAPGCSAVTGDIRAVGRSMSYVSLYAGLDRSATDLGFTGTNIWAYPTPDHDSNVARYYADPAASFPVLFISFPSAKDPEFEARHPGHSTIEEVAKLLGTSERAMLKSLVYVAGQDVSIFTQLPTESKSYLYISLLIREPFELTSVILLMLPLSSYL